MNEEIKKEYEIFKKKYTLPSFEVVDKELELSLLENKEFLLKQITSRLFDRIDQSVRFLEPILHPDTNSISNMNEYRFISDEEKAGLFIFFKKLMKIHRHIIGLLIDYDEEKTAKFVTEYFKEWPSIKKRLYELSMKLSESWEKFTEAGTNQDYLG